MISLLLSIQSTNKNPHKHAQKERVCNQTPHMLFSKHTLAITHYKNQTHSICFGLIHNTCKKKRQTSDGNDGSERLHTKQTRKYDTYNGSVYSTNWHILERANCLAANKIKRLNRTDIFTSSIERLNYSTASADCLHSTKSIWIVPTDLYAYQRYNKRKKNCRDEYMDLNL